MPKNASPDKNNLLMRTIMYMAIAVWLIVITAFVLHVLRVLEGEPLPDDIPSLIEMMGDDCNWSSDQMAAGRKLTSYGKAPFLIAIKHKNSSIRARAAHFLGLFKDPSVQDVLSKASSDPDPHVRMWSAFSLGRIGDARSLPVLRVLAQDSEEIVRGQAEDAIKQVQKRSKKK